MREGAGSSPREPVPPRPAFLCGVSSGNKKENESTPCSGIPMRVPVFCSVGPLSPTATTCVAVPPRKKQKIPGKNATRHTAQQSGAMTDIVFASEALRRGRRSMRRRFCCASCAALTLELVLAASVVAYAVVFLRGSALEMAGVLLVRLPVFVRPVLMFGAAMLPCARVSDVSKLAGPIAPTSSSSSSRGDRVPLSTRKTARALSYHRALGAWMVCDDRGVTTLRRGEALEDRGRGRIRDRADRHYYAYRVGVLPIVGLPADDPHGWLLANAPPHAPAAVTVLQDLVLDPSVARLLDREAGESRCGFPRRGGHRLADSIGLLLGQPSHAVSRSLGSCRGNCRVSDRDFGCHLVRLLRVGVGGSRGSLVLVPH